MDRMTKENLKELFQGNLNYMTWEKTYLQRKFHPDEYLKEVREHRREMFANQRENAPNASIDYEELLREHETHDIELQKRFEGFVVTHNGDKPLLVLDVDNTMVYVRFFSEEMQIGDIVTYFGTQSVCKNNSRVTEIRLTLSLDITSNTLIDKVGSERMECNYWSKNNELLKKYKKKNGVFDYKIDDAEVIGCKIRKSEVTGCKISVYGTALQLKHKEDEHEEECALQTLAIDFTKGNEELSKLEPMLERRGMADVDFIYEGFLVRCRPNLDEFLEYCSDDYDVCIYTSANKLIYEGMLEVLHEYVKDQLGRQDDDELMLWTDALYRDDCTLDYDERGKPYHHKDLTLFGCDLSRLIMVDNSPIVCRGEEPNFILIRDYFGKEDDTLDDELMEVYQLLDAMVNIEGDIRYFLCGLEEDEESQGIDVAREDECWSLTEKLMKQLDAYYSEQVAFSPISSDDYAIEAPLDDDTFMDDYDEEDILDRERLTSHSPQPVTVSAAAAADNEEEEEETSAEEVEETAGSKKSVRFGFTAPSVSVDVKPNASYMDSEKRARSLSAKKAQSTRFGFNKHRAAVNQHLKRNRSLLLDPSTLDNVTARHAKYSSMSPRYVLGVPGSDPGAKAKLSFFKDLDVNDAIHSFGAVDTDEEEDDPVLLDPKQVTQQKRHSLQDNEIQCSVPPQFDHTPHSIRTAQTMPLTKSADDDFIPPPNALKMKPMKSLDKIKAEKLVKRKKRLSEKRKSSMKLQVNSIPFGISLKPKKHAHRRGLSSDAIGEIDFTENDVGSMKRPGKTKHKMSIADTEQFGKVWRNTMAPRPSAKSILSASSKHDEFIVLFQQHLSQIKQENRTTRERHDSKFREKRRSVPDFAMLSRLDSEHDILAHRERLSTLRDDQMIHVEMSKPHTLQSVNENAGFDHSNTKKIESEWDDNTSQRHGCCYFFCCCCICNMCRSRGAQDSSVHVLL